MTRRNHEAAELPAAVDVVGELLALLDRVRVLALQAVRAAYGAGCRDGGLGEVSAAVDTLPVESEPNRSPGCARSPVLPACPRSKPRPRPQGATSNHARKVGH